MKRKLALFLAAIIAVTTVACGESEEPVNDEPDEDEEYEQRDERDEEDDDRPSLKDLIEQVKDHLNGDSDTDGYYDTYEESYTDYYETETAPPVETEPPVALETLPDMDFDGEEFVILNSKRSESWLYSLAPYEQDGDTINDEQFSMIRKVEDLYNVEISQAGAWNESSTAAYQAFEQVVLAGDSMYDCFSGPITDIASFMRNGLLTELSDMPYIDVSQPWWVQGANTALSLGGVQYGAVGTFDPYWLDQLTAVYVNEFLMYNNNLTPVPELVLDGTWTLDMFAEMSRTVMTDVNDDGNWGENDQYGWLGGTGNGIMALAAGAGAPLSLAKDMDDLLTCPFASESYGVVAEKLHDLLSGGMTYPDADGSGADVFAKEQSLFLVSKLYLSWRNPIYDMESDIAIVPLPKFDVYQDRYYTYGGDPYAVGVPITNADADFTGFIMEAMNAAAYDNELSYRALENIYRRLAYNDTVGEQMLDIIMDSAQYTIPFATLTINNFAIDGIRNGTPWASLVAAQEADVREEIEDIHRDFGY